MMTKEFIFTAAIIILLGGLAGQSDYEEAIKHQVEQQK